MAYKCVFFGKNCKKSSQRRRLRPRTPVSFRWLGPPSDPRVVIPTYYNFMEFIFGTKCVLFPLKKEQKTVVNVLICFFHAFPPIFHFKL